MAGKIENNVHKNVCLTVEGSCMNDGIMMAYTDMMTKLEEETHQFMISRLVDLNIDPDVLLKQQEEINRLRAEKEKYKWHDLRKNPDDLPEAGKIIAAKEEIDGEYFCGKTIKRYENVAIELVLYSKNDYYSYNTETIKGSEIIAWKYIDPFDEGE